MGLKYLGHIVDSGRCYLHRNCNGFIYNEARICLACFKTWNWFAWLFKVNLRSHSCNRGHGYGL